MTSITDPLGNVTTFEYDTSGNLTAITEPVENLKPAPERLKTRMTYNSYGQVLTITDPLNHTTTFTYTDAGDLATTTDPLGHTTTRTYDAVSRLSTQTDPLGRLTWYTYDILNRLSTLADPLQGLTSFTYDANGNLLTVRDAKGQTSTHTYDALNRLATRTDPLSRTESFAYDLAGNLQTVTDRKGQVTTYTYDSVNRPTQASYADATVATFTYDAASRLTQVNDTADPHRPITRTYDALDRLLTETTSLGTVTYTYDTAGRRMSMTVSGQAPVNYTYDANARLRTITQAPLNPATIEYDAANRRTLLTLPNEVSTEYQYDLASRLTAMVYRNGLGTLGDLQYAYDATGNRIATGGSFAGTLVPDSVTAASYDAANEQLAFGTVTQTFDANGNLLTRTDVTGTTTYTWDGRNRLTGIDGPSLAASFSYDALGRRVVKTINAQNNTFQYDGLDILQETAGSGAVSYLRTLAIDEALVRTDASSSLFYVSDALGSTVALTDPTGATPTSYTYAPFGDTAVTGTPSVSPFQFTGRENDGTGLYYYRARYYDPGRGRFVSEDLVGFSSGVNSYAYADANPLIYTDPLGLEPVGGERGATGGASGQRTNQPRKHCRELKPPDPRFVECRHHQTGKWIRVPRPPDMPFPEPKKSEICGEECRETIAAVAITATGTYLVYRCIRMLPSLAPPLWWTIPLNAATP